MATATYSPEDNKLRLYVDRVPRDEYEALRAAGFVSTPKQDCDFVATWTPEREDLALSYLAEGEDIDDEDYSPEERSADRAERFESGPAMFGHQIRDRAERQAMRHDRQRGHALTQWSKAEYWQQRTAGVIRHALHKSSAPVRRGRILRLEAEQRKHEKSREAYAARFAAWLKVSGMEGADLPIVKHEDSRFIGIDAKATSPAGRFAYALANSHLCYGDYTHPRTGRKSSLYSLLTDADDPITPAEAAALWLAGKREPSDPDSYLARWSRHYELRLTYENAMLANEGGTAGDAEMVPGGWLGRYQIERVNKSPATGRVVSVMLRNDEGKPKRLNVERFGESVYRAPTDEELAAFAKAQAERKASEKASKPAAPSLLNPIDADAERLQALWNAAAAEDQKRHKRYGQLLPSDVLRMTQAEYSARSKGAYASYETTDLSERLEKLRGWNRGGRVCVFKVRTASGKGWESAQRVIILTDKPQKPLPWDDAEDARAEQPTEESVFPTLGKLAAVLGTWHLMDQAENRALLDDAIYVGWAYSSSSTQQGFAEAGQVAYTRFRESAAA